MARRPLSSWRWSPSSAAWPGSALGWVSGQILGFVANLQIVRVVRASRPRLCVVGLGIAADGHSSGCRSVNFSEWYRADHRADGVPDRAGGDRGHEVIEPGSRKSSIPTGMADDRPVLEDARNAGSRSGRCRSVSRLASTAFWIPSVDRCDHACGGPFGVGGTASFLVGPRDESLRHRRSPPGPSSEPPSDRTRGRSCVWMPFDAGSSEPIDSAVKSTGSESQ